MEGSPEEKDSLEEMSFEEAYLQIEKIVKTLESGRGELEESLESYEKAVRLVRICRSKLDSASQRIEMLKGLDADGNPELEKLDENALRSKENVAGRQASSATSDSVAPNAVPGDARSAKPRSVPTRGAKNPSQNQGYPNVDDRPPF